MKIHIRTDEKYPWYYPQPGHLIDLGDHAEIPEAEYAEMMAVFAAMEKIQNRLELLAWAADDD